MNPIDVMFATNRTKRDLTKFVNYITKRKYPDDHPALSTNAILQNIYIKGLYTSEMVKCMLEHSPELIADPVELYMFASCINHIQLAEAVGEHIGFTATDSAGNTALMWAIDPQDTYSEELVEELMRKIKPVTMPEFIQALLEKGVDPYHMNNSYITAYKMVCDKLKCAFYKMCAATQIPIEKSEFVKLEILHLRYENIKIVFDTWISTNPPQILMAEEIASMQPDDTVSTMFMNCITRDDANKFQDVIEYKTHPRNQVKITSAQIMECSKKSWVTIKAINYLFRFAPELVENLTELFSMMCTSNNIQLIDSFIGIFRLKNVIDVETGDTPLHIAVKAKPIVPNVIQHLMKCGADPKIGNKDGLSAHDIVEQLLQDSEQEPSLRYVYEMVSYY